MRYFKIFLLHTQEVLQDRSRLFVWVLWTAVSPLLLLMFWRGAGPIQGWTYPQIASYYLLAIIIGVLLMCHHEKVIGTVDIQEGGLTAYLLKPFSYFWIKFFNELSYRLIEGIFAVGILIIFIHFFSSLFVFTQSLVILLLSVVVAIGALFLSFLFKSIFGLFAFWMTDARGAYETADVVMLILSGTLMPISFFPQWLEQITYLLPFPYIIYFPIIAFEGKLSLLEISQVLGMQLVWILLFVFIYQQLWRSGVKKYTGVGQ